MGEPRQVHVVFGAGQVGLPLAQRLVARGHAVRLVTRSGTDPGLTGVTPVRADATDPAAAAEAASGAAVLYHCMNPPYYAKVWAEVLPRLQESLVATAGRAGARLVVLDNHYPQGRTGGQPMSEATPYRPTSRKGEVRAQVSRAYEDAHRAGRARVVIGRAADFYGPRGVTTYFGPFFWRRALAGKAAQMLFDPAMPHAYHYVEDVAEGLATLGAAPDDAFGGWWMLPVHPAEPTRALVGRFASALGRSIRLSRVPPAFIAVASLVIPFVRELHEMGYQWQEPFLCDDSKFRDRFGVEPLTRDEAARRTVAWAVEAYKGAVARAP